MSPGTKTIHTRLAEVRKAIGALTKTDTADVGKFSYSYLSLDALLAAVRPAMDTAGIYDVQRFEATSDGLWLVTELTDGADTIVSHYPLPAKAGDDQVRGSAISYGRRYSLLTMLGLPTTDDDGAATHRRAQPAPAPEPAPDYEVSDTDWQELLDIMGRVDEGSRNLIIEWWGEHGDGRSKPTRDLGIDVFKKLLERARLEDVKTSFNAEVEDEPF